jgi:hypothetical protein
MGWNRRNGNLPNISTRPEAKVFCVDVLQFDIRLTGENAMVPQLR